MSRLFRNLVRGVSLTALAFWCPAASPAAELTVAAAANIQFALDEVIATFHTRHTGIRVRVAYGSSGNFFAQIQNQAPYDVFLSADLDYPRKLVRAGQAFDTNVFLYATGRIVVWASTNATVNPETLGLQALLAPGVRKIAIANPRHAPYGVAAVAALKALRVYEQVEPKLVYGEDIAQTAQFVQSGNADLGLLALALVSAPRLREAGRYWEIPPDTHPPVEQGGIILKRTKEPAAARAFRDFLLGEPGRAVLKRHGFHLPEK